MATIDDEIAEIQANIIDIKYNLGINPGSPYLDIRTRLDILESRISQSSSIVPNPFNISNTNITISGGIGEPLQNANDGSLYLREDSSENIYIHQNGSWISLNSSGSGSWSASGDLSGNSSQQTVIGLQGRALNNSVPANNQVISWDQINNYWYSANLPITFDDNLLQQNIIANRLNKTSYADSSKQGIINLGSFSYAYNNYVVICGGNSNSASSEYSFIGAGYQNRIIDINNKFSYSSIVCGNNNVMQGNYNIILNGFSNSIESNYSTILNGQINYITQTANNSIVLYGNSNYLDSPNSLASGNSNSISGNSTFSQSHGQYNNLQCASSYIHGDYNIVRSNYSQVYGLYGKSIHKGQIVNSLNSINTTAGFSQKSSLIMDGSSNSGAQINLKNYNSNLLLEDNKAYDINLRILVASNSGVKVCASYIYDILAHVESGVLYLDKIQNTLINDNFTGWTITITNSLNELIIYVNSFGSENRSAIATIEWRELSFN